MTSLLIHLPVGAAYADKLWEEVVQNMREDEVVKKMQEMNIAQQRRAAESTPSVKTEPRDDKREAMDTSNFHLDTLIKENTTGSPGTLLYFPRLACFMMFPGMHRPTSFMYMYV